MLAGYPLGLHYVRGAPYTVTSGDVMALQAASYIGLFAAATTIANAGAPHQVVDGALTAGLLAGATAGDRLLVRRFDLTEREGLDITLGALAGGVFGVALPLAAKVHNPGVYTGLGTLGAAAGLAITTRLIRPAAGWHRESGRPRRIARRSTA